MGPANLIVLLIGMSVCTIVVLIYVSKALNNLQIILLTNCNAIMEALLHHIKKGGE